MRIISKRALRDYSEQHPRAKDALLAWHRVVGQADWQNYNDLRRDYPSADLVGDCLVFNIRGNAIRLIARMRFRLHVVYVLKVMTHAEYDRNQWPDECGCYKS